MAMRASGNRALKSMIPSLRNALFLAARTERSALNRGFATSPSVLKRRPDESDDIDVESSHRPNERRSADLFDTINDPFFPFRSLGLGLDQLFESPFFGAPRGGVSSRGAARRPWDAVEDAESLRLRVDMPGLGKGDVKVYAEENSLVIKGEAEGDAELDGSGRKYSSRIDLPPKIYKLDQIKAQMKNGVLNVTVPKFKEGEGKNVFDVEVE